MKKIIVCVVLAAILASVALAESIDLSGLSFDELAQLRDRCQMEMMQRTEWQEVRVPHGLYKVGVQIPAGTWTVRCNEGYLVEIAWGDTLRSGNTKVDYSRHYGYEGIYNPKDDFTKSDDRTEYTFTVNDGDYIEVDGIATFTPGASAPSFTFK